MAWVYNIHNSTVHEVEFVAAHVDEVVVAYKNRLLIVHKKHFFEEKPEEFIREEKITGMVEHLNNADTSVRAVATKLVDLGITINQL